MPGIVIVPATIRGEEVNEVLVVRIVRLSAGKIGE
jgi:hypothetical protein